MSIKASCSIHRHVLLLQISGQMNLSFYPTKVLGSSLALKFGYLSLNQQVGYRSDDNSTEQMSRDLNPWTDTSG